MKKCLSVKWVTWFCMLMIGICFLTRPLGVQAQTQVQITACEADGSSGVVLTAVVPDDFWGTYEIYRAQQGGSEQLLDAFPSYGTTWYQENGSYWRTKGQNGTMYCYADESEISGTVLFYDSTAALGITYSYRIVLMDDEEEVASSNVVTGATQLDTPVFLKTYAEGTTAKLAWMKSAKAQGYELYRKSGTKWSRIKTISKASTVKYNDKKLKSGKTYQYKLRAYRVINGKKVYSSFSDVCKVKMKTATVKGNYKSGSVYGPSLSTGKLSQVRQVVQSFKDNYIKNSMSDYEKVWMAFCYLRANCDYAWRGWQYNGANTAWGALIYGEAQCSGYARAMKALCDGIGVKCYYVHANSKASNPSHQWNLVRVGGKWYVLDAQGGFFLVGSQSYQSMTGMKWDTKGLPSCSKSDHAQGGFVSSEI